VVEVDDINLAAPVAYRRQRQHHAAAAGGGGGGGGGGCSSSLQIQSFAPNVLSFIAMI